MNPAATTRPRRRRSVVVTVLLLAVAGGATACTREGNGPALTNAADAVVTVRSADGEVVSDIDPDGGAMVLTDDCLEAPVVVTYEGGEDVTFDAPVCPGQELLIGNGAVRLVERSPS